MKIGEVWKFKNSSIIKRDEFQYNDDDGMNDEDLFYIIFPEVIKIIGKLPDDLWEVVAMYKKEENEREESKIFKTFLFVPTGEAETNEMTGEQIYNNYDLVRDESFMDNYEEGELYEMKELERDKND
jgi:hypothetical protein